MTGFMAKLRMSDSKRFSLILLDSMQKIFDFIFDLSAFAQNFKNFSLVS